MPDTTMPAPEFDAPGAVASQIDALTHAELLCLYRDAEENIRFSKLAQWRTTGGALAVFLLLALLAPERYGGGLRTILGLATLVAAIASVYALAILQSWQGTEREKIQTIVGELSDLAGEIYGTKSKVAADIERYVLLCFMCGAILIGCFLTLCHLMRWFVG